MLQPLKITLVICYTVLVLSVAGVLLSGILGRLEWLALCAVCALALLSITLVLGKNLRIQRMMTNIPTTGNRPAPTVTGDNCKTKFGNGIKKPELHKVPALS